MKIIFLLVGCVAVQLLCAQTPSTRNLFEFDNNSAPRWSSFENITAAKGGAAMENNGAKGHPSNAIEPGETKVLLNVTGAGIIQRMWFTVIDRSPEMLRSLQLEMFWDNSKTPAVSVPFGDFFGMGLGQTTSYHNVFFANPEGRSFQCFIPMPFKTAARIQITNQGGKRLTHLFFDINFEKINNWKPDYLYLHSYWNRDTATTLGKDFELLPLVKGRGRFLGVNIGVADNPVYQDYWWGEGEVKMYLDGDTKYPTLAGTGAEDYIGTGWGQGLFFNDYAGCLLANKNKAGWAFYRYHVPDPIYFKTDCRVTIQQMGSNSTPKVIELQKTGAPMIPVSIDSLGKIIPLYATETIIPLTTPGLPTGYSNFYRSDDISATAYFYLDKPAGVLPATKNVAIKTARLTKQ